MMLMLLAAMSGHEMSHELLDPVILHGHITATPDASNAANSAALMMLRDHIGLANPAKQT